MNQTKTGQASLEEVIVSQLDVVDDELLAAFKVESEEQLDVADEHLLTLESDPTDLNALNAIFRAFHTIKGNAGFLRIDPALGSLAHDAETVLALCREGKMRLEGEAFELALDSSRILRLLVLQIGPTGVSGFNPALQAEATSLRQHLVNIANSGQSPNAQSTKSQSTKGKSKTTMRKPRKNSQLAGDAAVDANDASSPAFENSEHFDFFMDEQEEGDDARNSLSAEPQQATQPQENLVHPTQDATNPSSKAPNKTPVVSSAASQGETLRVDRARLDQLVELIGELVIAESMAQQDAIVASVDNTNASVKSRNLAQLNRITRMLQELSLSLRMVNLRSTFQKMTRVARDLMRKLGKNVDFIVEGENTELDKTVVDEIGDPLMHMVRNAIDHGIESSEEERIALGKPARGRVVLRAFHQSGNIHIEIQDDGKGLNAERILAKAKAQKIVAEDANLSESEILALIFEPGFSTAEKVTDVSGRGVGMDVVRRNIQALRGSVDIKTKLGEGSCFTIRMPLTLAIIDGLVVRSGTSRFVIPTLSVTELMQLKGANISTITEKHAILTVRDQNVPLLNLSRMLGLPSTDEDVEKGIIVVVQEGPYSAALSVDEVLGQQQVVIKQLGHNMEGCKGVAGGAIMPDGQVGIILDNHGIISQARGKA